MINATKFWGKVDKTSGECWLWRSTIDLKGYGRFSVGGRKTKVAHRIAYELGKGPIPAGLTIDHLCRVRHCVNPAHLEAVPNAINVLRGFGPTAINKRKTICIHGHEFTPANTKFAGKSRQCRLCNNARTAIYRNARLR